MIVIEEGFNESKRVRGKSFGNGIAPIAREQINLTMGRSLIG
jgi:hypothetical protein